MKTLDDILAATRHLPPVRAAFVHPASVVVMQSLAQALAANMVDPVLVGPERKIREAAAEAGLDLSGIRLVATEHSHAAAEQAVRMARDGEVSALVKGKLGTAELMDAVVAREAGLRTGRRMSHVFVMEVATWPKLLLITDAAINVTPDLDAKRDIAQNAIDLAHALGIAQPKVAILAAVEKVNARLPTTLDAAALCKMADRGQITGGVLDGPLAFDNAISRDAAREKNIVSPVAGDVDVLLVPDIEAGNLLAKQLYYLANAREAGIVLGARVPIVLTSRAEAAFGRLASLAIAALLAAGQPGAATSS